MGGGGRAPAWLLPSLRGQAATGPAIRRPGRSHSAAAASHEINRGRRRPSADVACPVPLGPGGGACDDPPAGSIPPPLLPYRYPSRFPGERSRLVG